MSLVVRSGSDPKTIIPAVRDVVWDINPDQSISHVMTMDDMLDGMIAQRRLNMVLFTIFAAVALILAAVGVYGVMSYSVTQREHEMGIRMALGATGGAVLRLVLKQGFLVTLAGIFAGLAGAVLLTWVLSTIMSDLLYQVSTTDPLTYIIIPFVLTAVALAACLVPALRATRVDPMTALRYE
jgi:putative ABC transport system permease protein